MGKWLAGILATVLAGVVLSMLTREGSPFNPAKRQPPPHIPTPTHLVITAFDADPAHLNGRMIGRFTIYNDGETTAEQCHIYFGEKRAEEGGISESAFGVPPRQSTSISTGLYWTGNNPNLHGIRVIARAYCKGGIASDTSDRIVSVEP
jgi:hypothetical protein